MFDPELRTSGRQHEEGIQRAFASACSALDDHVRLNGYEMADPQAVKWDDCFAVRWHVADRSANRRP